MVDVMALSLLLKEEGSATLKASLRTLGAEVAKTVATFASVTYALNKFVAETAESQRVQADLASALAATNGASGQTIESLNKQAEALMNVSAFGDEAIGSAQALLLMYTNISGAIYEQSLPAILDLATKLRIDLSSAASMVGKALQDPANGLTALNRQTRLFSEDQQKYIKALAESGRVTEAQGIILKQLEGRLNGAAEAYRNTLGGALAALREQFGNLFEANEKTGNSMVGSINAINDMVRVLKGPVQFVFENFIKGIVTIGSLVAQVGLAIVRFFAAIGAAALTFIGAFGTLLPGIGDDIGRMVDDMNEKVSENDTYFEGLQNRLRDWRTEVVMGTSAARDMSGALGGMGDAFGSGGRKKPTIEELGQREGMTFFTPQPRGAFLQDLRAKLAGLIPAAKPLILSEAEALALEMQTTFQQTMSAALVGGITGGIEQAIASGSISEGFKAMSSMMLAGLGDAMIAFGTQSATFAGLMKTIMDGLTFLNPETSLVAAIALIAAGSALKGVARGMFGGQKGGAASSVRSFGGNSVAPGLPTTQLVFGSTSATTGSGMNPMTPMNVTVIGPNDPSAQRAIQELMNKANNRGRLP
jgi:hypothetical protein